MLVLLIAPGPALLGRMVRSCLWLQKDSSDMNPMRDFRFSLVAASSKSLSTQRRRMAQAASASSGEREEGQGTPGAKWRENTSFSPPPPPLEGSPEEEDRSAPRSRPGGREKADWHLRSRGHDISN